MEKGCCHKFEPDHEGSNDKNHCPTYQSPIKLETENQTVFHAKGNIKPSFHKIKSRYNKEKHQWDVLNRVELINNDKKYYLDEFHFHYPGEHIINDEKFPLEVHFVYENVDNKCVTILVVAFVIDISDKTSKALDKIIKKEKFSLPKIGNYFTYPGSLTTSPFDTSVNWNVSERKLYITEKNLKKLVKKSKARRRIKPRQGRNIVYACNSK